MCDINCKSAIKSLFFSTNYIGINVYEENAFKQNNLQSIEALDKHSRVTCMNWGDDDQTEILIGRENKFVKVYNVTNNEFSSNLEMEHGPVVGVARFNDVLVAASETGKIQILEGSTPSIIETGSNLSRMRQCKLNKNLFATGGKERDNRLKIWNLSTKQNVFISKNLPHDNLQLEVPIWDSDFDFFDENCVATCSRYGYVRVFDTRAQRRPVQKYASKEQISFSCLTLFDKNIYCGTTTGIVRAFDSRNLKNPIHTYKGFTGGVKDITIDETGKYLATAALDRFVRIHDAHKTAMLYQTYIKSKGTAILLKTNDCVIVKNEEEICEENEDRLDDEEEEDEEQKKSNLGGKRKQKQQQQESSTDDEYEKMFEKMETVGDGDKQQPPKKKKRKFKKK